MSISRLLAVATLAVALSGCGPLIEFAASSAGLPSPAKRVADKAPPDLLVADDGTTCRVPEARYRRIARGDHITCVWTGSPAFRKISTPRY